MKEYYDSQILIATFKMTKKNDLIIIMIPNSQIKEKYEEKKHNFFSSSSFENWKKKS